jgi:iron complex outermembrane receptor protein
MNQKSYFEGYSPSLSSLPNFSDNRTPSQAATYAQAELKLLSSLTINAGGRLDWFDGFGVSLSPRIAVIYSPSSRTSLKYILGRAFRTPNTYEAYYTDGISISANTNLKPETMLSHDVVLEHRLKPWLQLTIEGFYSSMQKLIDLVPDPASGLSHFINDGQNVGKGLEFEIGIKRKSGLSGAASYTLSDVRDSSTDARLNNSPLHLAKVRVSIPVLQQGSANVELLYASAQDSYQSTRVPASLLANITFLSKPLWNGWTFSTSCYNAFNRRWFTPAGPGLQQAEILQDGRTYRVKLTYLLPHRERREKQ